LTPHLQSQRLIFSKWTPPGGGSTTLYVDGLGSIVTEMSPTMIKFDNALGVKAIWTRNAPVVTSQPAAVQPVESAADKIRALKALKDDGILSEKEFEDKKAKLVASM
jgi:hypothetical protein